MELILRNCTPEDAPQIGKIFRDSHNVLRQSRGGLHNDKYIDAIISKTDPEIYSILTAGSTLILAQIKGAGQVIGMGAFTTSPFSRLIGSSYSHGAGVLEAFQRGKSGVNVGRMIREEILARASAMGFRKLYGFSAPEAIGFHKRFGAVFYPASNRFQKEYGLEIHYYEIEIKKSFWNRIRIEPYAYALGLFYGRALSSIRRMLGR